jgi:replicative DNA helicase
MQRMLPSNMEAECGVLGSLIIDPEAIVQVIDFLGPEDFYRDAHQVLYKAILTLYHDHTPADFINICDQLERENKLEDIGGAGYIASLANQVPTSANAQYYGRIVERTGVLRRLIHASGQIAALAYESDEGTADKALSQAEGLLFAVRQSHLLGEAKSPLIRENLAAFIQRLDQLNQRRDSVSGVPTGFKDLDRLLGGLQRSDLIILAARPAVGKTGLALSLAYNAAVRHQRKIGIFSLEMSQEQMIQRLVSMDAGVDQQRLRTGWIEDEEWERIIEAMSTLGEAMILIDDTAAISPMQLRSKARQWTTEYGALDLIIVDYLQLMHVDTTGRRSDTNRVQIIDEISNELKALARELNIPVLALAQLSRAVELRHSKVPQLSDLRESGSLEQNADVVMFIYRDEVYNPGTERPNQADILIAKHRNGPVGEVVLYFERSQTRFRDLETSPPLGEME